MHLEKGREAFQRSAWSDAYRHLGSADDDKALPPSDLMRLATAAYLIGANQEGIEALTRAHRTWLDTSEVARAARCACLLGFMLVESGEFPRATGWFSRAQRILDDAQLDCAERGYVLLPTGIRQVTGGDAPGALRTFTEAVSIGKRFQEPELVAFARHGQGRARIRARDVEEGLALLDEAMVGAEAGDLSPVLTGIVYCSAVEGAQEVFDLHRARAWTTALSAWCAQQPDMVPFRGQCLVARSEIMRDQGTWTDAVREARRACEQLEGPPRRPAAGAAFYQRAELHRLQGEFEAAEQAYADATERGRMPQPGLALLRLAQGRIEAAESAISRLLVETSGAARRSKALSAYVEIQLAAQEVGRAQEAASELAGIAEELASPALRAHAAYATGSVLMSDHDARGALPWLRQSLSAWDDLGVPYEAARARILLARACRSLGDDDTADMHAGAAHATLETLGASPVVAMPENSENHRSARREATGLTERELQVLRLVAAGDTNKAIGAALDISERTVERHVSNIFDKIGVSTRSAATAFAYENDLL